MKKLFVCISLIFVAACSQRSAVVLKDTDLLKYGQRASVFQKAWGEPDETMAFQNYQAKRYYYSSGAGGYWGPSGGSFYGYSSGSTYVPTTIVWIYKEKGKVLFFQKGYLLYDSPGAVPMIWRLVGWENLKSEKISSNEEKARTTKAPGVTTAKIEAHGDPIFIKSISSLKDIKTSDLIQKSVQAVVTIRTEGGHGSGFLISDDGYLITNFHVISGRHFIDVLLPNKIVLQSEVVRADQNLDLALLKLKGSGFSTLPLGDSDKIQPGEEVFAIGTPAYIELGQSVSKGIISGIRKIEEKDYIQTDVKVNTGNSGGPLINLKGEVVGVIEWKLDAKGYEGLAFCIPINIVGKSLNIISK